MHADTLEDSFACIANAFCLAVYPSCEYLMRMPRPDLWLQRYIMSVLGVSHSHPCFPWRMPSGSETNSWHAQVQKRLIWALIICFIFMIVEVVGGYLANR